MSKQTMKAVRLHEFGGPEVLRYEDVPKPGVKPGEVLVRVRAVGVNPPDWYLRDGYTKVPNFKPPVALPAILGSDISGLVESVGEAVQGFSIGDEVFSMVRFPSFGDSAAYAEYVTVPVAQLSRKPAGVGHIHAAAAPMASLTAWQFLIDLGHNEPNPFQTFPHRPVPLQGRTVVVNGAAGGVGHVAVQLAKWKGAKVIAVASGSHEEFVRSLGADEFIDYRKNSPEDVVRDVDVVLDTVGGPETGRFLRTLKRGGALFPVFLGFSDPEEASKREITVSMTQVRSNGAQLAEIGHLIDDGTLRIAIDSVFPLSEARKAHERAEEGHIRGKIVLTVE